MTKGDIIVGLDIGTSIIRAIIGEVEHSGISVIGVGTAKSDGIKKGAIVDIDKTVVAIREAVNHAERMVGIDIQSAYISVSGNHIALQPSHGIVAVSSEDREIGDEDVERVIAATRVINLPPDREIVDVVPREYTVDGLSEVSDPRGMIGVRLEVDVYVVTGSRTVLHNLLRCVERAGLEVAGTVFTPLAAAGMILSPDERRLGVTLVDVGAGSTTVSVFENGLLERYAIIPIGSDSVTNDISVGLELGYDTAEMVKLRYGIADISLVKEEEKFKAHRIGSQEEQEFTVQKLEYIIESRMQEIYALVKLELERQGYPKGLPGGYVLTGGGMLLRGADRLAAKELDAQVRIAVPDFVGVRDPSYVSCVSMVQYVSRMFGKQMVAASSSIKRKSSGSAFSRLKNWLQDFI
ncbi:cell division protein FtsA [Ferroacidibacillus organovorans]|uniref:Cell division protein FtsA n=1 Tax=Ferroacidibacillus organovorans TaxID=1765683 RepID=A0A853KBH8_9BACL|nr:cell division protein FtsA [Ferroacidibacillus organovorans]KYP81863.1 cell division protein FtsA [Ferroacidibacillus organovorans]OAG94183.1 cell division protein FtsA [Ferroacidibacillus organovorans]